MWKIVLVIIASTLPRKQRSMAIFQSILFKNLQATAEIVYSKTKAPSQHTFIK